jgi:DNA-binding CsgD family transcriptional regulator
MLSFEDFVEQTRQAKTVRQLQTRFQRAMLDEGYENTIFCRISLGKLEDVVWHKFPDGYLKTYVELGWERIDPILGYSLRSVRPFRWDEVVHDVPLTRKQLEYLKETVRMGVPMVNVVPFSSPVGGRELVAFGERKAKRADPARRPILQAMCAQLWSRHGELVGSRRTIEDDGPRLTHKELEILRWMKHGKSNAEIAEIQGLSVKTIEYHVGNILKKLGAANRVTAVVKAIRDGLLPL